MLLSKILLAFAIEFESESEVSLAISANVLRHLGDQGSPVRDLPRLSGVSKESIAMALGFLGKQSYIVIHPESPANRGKVVALTPKGRLARDKYEQLVWVLEQRRQERFGADKIANLRELLEPLVGSQRAQSPLFGGLEPYPDGWRASVPRPQGLPHFPMVLHRGGFPDGS